MSHSVLPSELQLQLREFIAQQIGLHFPAARWVDLQRGLIAALREMGFSDLTAGARRLLSGSLTKAQIDVLVRHLTIGETYFLRDKNAFEILGREVLPQLVHSRRKAGDRRLRIWSAGCCTGEEPYSLSILLQQTVPDLAEWFVTILATDVNTRFLQIAAAGLYGNWSFRETPPGFRDRYFTKTAEGRYAILPEIKNRVTFMQVNLVWDAFPTLVAETNAMDLVLCRNVLMYFSPEQARKVVANLRRALIPGGWLVVSPSETSQYLFSQFITVNYPGVILYRRPPELGSVDPHTRRTFEIPPVAAESLPDSPAERHLSPPTRAQPSLVDHTSLAKKDESLEKSEYSAGNFPSVSDPQSVDVPAFSRFTRSLANEGKLAEALAWCDRWVEAERLEPSGHYFRGVLLQELGDADQARRSFQASLYLDPQFVLAHFALGNLARSRGMVAQATRHFANALSLLKDYRPDETLPEADGLTAGRLREMIASITTLEVVS